MSRCCLKALAQGVELVSNTCEPEGFVAEVALPGRIANAPVLRRQGRATLEGLGWWVKEASIRRKLRGKRTGGQKPQDGHADDDAVAREPGERVISHKLQQPRDGDIAQDESDSRAY